LRASVGSASSSAVTCARGRWYALATKSSRGTPVDLLALGGPDRDLLALQFCFELRSPLLAELGNEFDDVTHACGGCSPRPWHTHFYEQSLPVNVFGRSCN